MRAVDEFRSFVATSFEQLSTSVLPWVSAIAYRVNRVFPKDGTEVMLAPLPLQHVANADLLPASDETGNLVWESDGANRFLGSDGFNWVNLMSPPASTAVAGIMEIANSAETVGGIIGSKAVSPDGLTDAFRAPPGDIGAVTPPQINGTTYFGVSTHASTSILFSKGESTSYTGNLNSMTSATVSGTGFNFITCFADNFNDLKFKVRGDGAVTADGSFTGGGADVAEWKPWWDGNPKNEDRTGISVTFFEGKLRQAYPGDSVVGIISADPAFICGGDIEGVDGQLNGCVGFAGSIPLIRGQEVDERWVKLEDMDDGRELWWVR